MGSYILSSQKIPLTTTIGEYTKELVINFSWCPGTPNSVDILNSQGLEETVSIIAVGGSSTYQGPKFR